MIKAILMDFNGVIINDEPIQHAAYKDIFAGDGIDVTDEMYYSRLGMDDKTFVASILQEAGRESDMDRVLEVTAAKTKLKVPNARGYWGFDGYQKLLASDLDLVILATQ